MKLRKLFREATLHLQGRRALLLCAWLSHRAEREPDRRRRELLEYLARDAYVEGHLALLRSAGI